MVVILLWCLFSFVWFRYWFVVLNYILFTLYVCLVVWLFAGLFRLCCLFLFWFAFAWFVIYYVYACFGFNVVIVVLCCCLLCCCCLWYLLCFVFVVFSLIVSLGCVLVLCMLVLRLFMDNDLLGLVLVYLLLCVFVGDVLCFWFGSFLLVYLLWCACLFGLFVCLWLLVWCFIIVLRTNLFIRYGMCLLFVFVRCLC